MGRESLTLVLEKNVEICLHIADTFEMEKHLFVYWFLPLGKFSLFVSNAV